MCNRYSAVYQANPHNPMDRKTRILFVHQVSQVGGGSYCLLNIVRSLDRSFFEPVVLLQGDGSLAVEFRRLGVRTVFLESLGQIPYNWSLVRPKSIGMYCRVFRSLKAFEQIVRKECIDIVYLNNMMISPYLIPAKRAGCKTVMHVREHWPLDEHRLQLNWLRRIVRKHCDRLIAINRFSASIFPNNHACIVYDSVDMESRYKYMPLEDIFQEDCSGKKIILYTGGISTMKGADYVINAFSDSVKGDDYRLLVLGNPAQQGGWKYRLKRLLYKVGIDRGVRMMDNLAKDPRIKCIPPLYELTHLIRQSHCFVSYFRMPHANLALAEALILGKSSLAADTEEAREYTDNGRYAMLVPPNRPKLFAEKLNSFLADMDRWTGAAALGSAPLAAMFDKKTNEEKLNRELRLLAEV